jgi:hypothetical protein
MRLLAHLEAGSPRAEIQDDLEDTMKDGLRKVVLGVVAVVAVASAAGCARVAPYERGTLAHPTMSAEDPFTSGLDQHVRAISEGASGGLSGGGGGCGCN